MEKPYDGNIYNGKIRLKYNTKNKDNYSDELIDCKIYQQNTEDNVIIFELPNKRYINLQIKLSDDELANERVELNYVNPKLEKVEYIVHRYR